MADPDVLAHFGTPPSPGSQAEDDHDEEEDMLLSLTVHHHGTPHEVRLPPSSTLQDLSAYLDALLSVPTENQKLLISGGPKTTNGVQKPPFPLTPVSSLPVSSPRFKITLLGSTSGEIESLDKEVVSSRAAHIRRNHRTYPVKPATPSPSTSRSGFADMSSSSSSSSEYTFHKLLPLSYLPNPDRSLSFLARLRDDRGIASAMRKHRFSVPVLTEMDPAPHTTESGRTLGLNRNRGEVIELRLRTDAYDGYRDYRTIRRTLCHELAHCVHGNHDSDFWALMRQIERDVERGDYWGSEKGRRLTEQEFYNPGDWEEMEGREDEVVDHGGWTGGEFVLGGLQGESSSSSGRGRGLNRREILARAAEERMGKEKDKGKQSDGA